MTWIQTTYTVRLIARHRTTGQRYKAVPVELSEGGSSGDIDYFSTLLDYIHLNYPFLRAGSAESLRILLPAVAA